MLLCDKTSRMMKADESRQHQFSNGSEGLKLFRQFRLHLAAHSACSVTISVDSGFGKSLLKRREDFCIPQHGDGKETDMRNLLHLGLPNRSPKENMMLTMKSNFDYPFGLL